MFDKIILSLLESGCLRVDPETGCVYSPKSNVPTKPLGSKTRKGYLRTCINATGCQHYIMLHRVVCIAFHGMPLLPNLQVNHRNGKKDDNRPINLEWSTHKENMAHAKQNGFHKCVGRHDGIRDAKGRFGKKAAGRQIDGREHNELSEATP